MNERDSRHPQSAGPPLNLEQTRIILQFGQSILCLMERSIKKLQIIPEVLWEGKFSMRRVGAHNISSVIDNELVVT